VLCVLRPHRDRASSGPSLLFQKIRLRFFEHPKRLDCRAPHAAKSTGPTCNPPPLNPRNGVCPWAWTFASFSQPHPESLIRGARSYATGGQCGPEGSYVSTTCRWSSASLPAPAPLTTYVPMCPLDVGLRRKETLRGTRVRGHSAIVGARDTTLVGVDVQRQLFTATPASPRRIWPMWVGRSAVHWWGSCHRPFSLVFVRSMVIPSLGPNGAGPLPFLPCNDLRYAPLLSTSSRDVVGEQRQLWPVSALWPPSRPSILRFFSFLHKRTDTRTYALHTR